MLQAGKINNTKKPTQKVNSIGRPPKYKSKEEIEEKIEKYFKDCEGYALTDKAGNPVFDKHENPIIVGQRPPTITGLALALGFTSRQALLDYQAKKEFLDTITRAKTRVEQYTEERLFDRDGTNGAQFSLRNNFKGWNRLEERKMEIELLKLESQLKDGTPEAEPDDNFMEALNNSAQEVWNEATE